MSPFTVARMTIVNLRRKARCCSACKGINIPNTLGQCGLITEQENNRYSMTNRLAMKSNVLWPILRACVADVLAARHQAGGNFFLHRAEACNAETIQQMVAHAGKTSWTCLKNRTRSNSSDWTFS